MESLNIKAQHLNEHLIVEGKEEWGVFWRGAAARGNRISAEDTM